MVTFFRKRRALRLPITLSVVLMSLNVVLMIAWIIMFATYRSWSGLAVGAVTFSLILVGLSFYLVLTIKEIRLNQRQANFIDSVTHELKTPIASLRLYLETLQMRTLDDKQRVDFYDVMNKELQRLDLLISQLLEVGRLDAIGHETEPERIDLEALLRKSAERSTVHHHLKPDSVFQFDVQPVTLHARRIVLEMLFGNLLENAVKYGGEPPEVLVTVRKTERNHRHRRRRGPGIPQEDLPTLLPWRVRIGTPTKRDRFRAVHCANTCAFFEGKRDGSRPSRSVRKCVSGRTPGDA